MKPEAITFDCYGTLIDWETGLLAELRPRLPGLTDAEILKRYAQLEAELEAGPYRPYRELLGKIEQRMGLEPGGLAASLPGWPPFPDTVRALKRLGKDHWLAVVSNIDDDLFEGTQARLGVAFDQVVTAKQVRSYKPKLAHFEAVLDRLMLKPQQVLHAAQSLFHDIAPAKAMGFRTCWITRRGLGATLPSPVKADFEFPDVKSLADHLAA